MMREMYDWYMENLGDYHLKEYHKFAEKESKKKQRNSKTTRNSSSMVVRSVQDYHDLGINALYTVWNRSPGSGGKWENVAVPFMMNTVDNFIILNPLLPPKMRAAAAMRQFHEWNRLVFD